MASHTLVFQNEALANALVAGLPSAVRIVHELQQNLVLSPTDEVSLVTPGGWRDTAHLEQEIARVCPAIRVQFLPQVERMTDGEAIDAQELLAYPAQASKRIIANTGKPTDGLVSRLINRPISQFISLQALKFPGVRPIHGTVVAALIGVAMALCLFFGGIVGLYAGAVLFQLASIIDGVDGEIARATLRSSKLGATLDTASDAATNFAFIAGVSFNLWQQGETLAGQMGFAGLGLLAIGLAIIGWLSVRAGGPLSFDALKHDAQVTASPVMNALAKITSRDVYALALAVMILIGLAGLAIMVFASAIAAWFVTAMAMLWRKAAR